jgi:hypothetical protein
LPGNGPCNHVTIFYFFEVNFNMSHLRLSLKDSCYMTRSSNPPWLDNPVILVNNKNFQCSLTSCYFLFRRSKYSPQNLVIKHPHHALSCPPYRSVLMQITVLKSLFLLRLEAMSPVACLMKTLLL